MWLGQLPTSVCRMCPLPIFFHFSFVIIAVCRMWLVCRIPFAECVRFQIELIFSFLVCSFAVCRMWLSRLPDSVCRMCPAVKLNLLMRPGSIFECRGLPIVAVLFVTLSSRLSTVARPFATVASIFAEYGRRVCENLFSECVVTRSWSPGLVYGTSVAGLTVGVACEDPPVRG